MDISLYVLKIEVMGKQTELTLKIAKQFPILDFNLRYDQAIEGWEFSPNPICKINAKTLGIIGEWLYLVEDEMAGLAWVRPVIFAIDEEKIIERGGWVDHPEKVTTIVLMR